MIASGSCSYCGRRVSTPGGDQNGVPFVLAPMKDGSWITICLGSWYGESCLDDYKSIEISLWYREIERRASADA